MNKKLNASFTPNKSVSKELDPNRHKRKMSQSNVSESPTRRKRKCKYCEQIETKRSNMRNHSLNHFKDKLCNILPPSTLVKPFPCPICKHESRDKITMLRHVGFAHRKIFDFCTDEDLLGVEISDEIVQNISNDTNGGEYVGHTVQ